MRPAIITISKPIPVAVRGVIDKTIPVANKPAPMKPVTIMLTSRSVISLHLERWRTLGTLHSPSGLKRMGCLNNPSEELLREFIHALGSHGTIAGIANRSQVVNGHVSALTIGNDVTTVETAIGDFDGAAANTVG